MKKVLIIAYYWPPSSGSGVQRWLKFVKYLPEFNWQPIVYTPENPDFKVLDNSLLKDIPEEAIIVKRPIWEPYKFYRLFSKKKSSANFGMTKSNAGSGLFSKLALWVRGNIFIPDPRIFWVKPSTKYLKKLIKREGISHVVTTGPPHSMHLIALGLKKWKPELFWVADMRDPWSQFDIHNSFFNEKSKAKNAAFEANVIQSADRIVTVTPSLHTVFQSIPKNKLRIIPNGFDDSDFESKPVVEKDQDTFKIYYTGIMSAIQNPSGFWIALENLCRENSEFRAAVQVEIIGILDEKITHDVVSNPLLNEVVNIRGWMSHDALIAEWSKADLLLLLSTTGLTAKVILTGKLFEYMALKKPVIALCPTDGDMAQVIKETKLGSCYEFEDSEGIQQALLQQFTAFKENIEIAPNHEAILKYTRKNLTKEYVQLLNESEN